MLLRIGEGFFCVGRIRLCGHPCLHMDSGVWTWGLTLVTLRAEPLPRGYHSILSARLCSRATLGGGFGCRRRRRCCHLGVPLASLSLTCGMPMGQFVGCAVTIHFLGPSSMGRDARSRSMGRDERRQCIYIPRGYHSILSARCGSQ